MDSKTALDELRRRTDPYLFFWEEWTAHEECCLEREEKDLVNTHLKNGFRIRLFSRHPVYNKQEHICAVSRKLLRCYPLFQEWVIFKFLCTLIRMAALYGSDSFFNDPIAELGLPEELKLNLAAFRLHHIGQLPQAYKAGDLKRSWVYRNIVDFHRLDKKLNLCRLATPGPGSMRVEKIP